MCWELCVPNFCFSEFEFLKCSNVESLELETVFLISKFETFEFRNWNLRFDVLKTVKLVEQSFT